MIIFSISVIFYYFGSLTGKYRSVKYSYFTICGLGIGFRYFVSGDLPSVPNTIVIKPPPATAAQTSQPSLTIYYDAMEENSQVFVNTTLLREFSCFSSYIDISLIPCQLAKEQSGDLSCPAQADPLCNLDKVHSCAIAQTTDMTQLINFLGCTMCTVKKIPDFLTCAIRNKLDDQQLQTCASSDTGKNLCKKYSEEKMPDTNTMPGFIFKNPNDIQSTDKFEHLDHYINNVCVTDFQSAVCAQLKATKATAMPQECDKKLVIGIFYKAMDANSQKWIQSLAAIYAKFSAYLVLKFEPCMFAELTDDSTSGSLQLDCKDDADTGCVAATTHACAISIIKDPQVLFQFLNCTMQDATKLPDFEKCATSCKIQYDSIKTCASGDLGKRLCFDYSKTRPNSDKIPSFSYELTFDETVSDNTASATNLQTVICQQLKLYGIIYPADCATA